MDMSEYIDCWRVQLGCALEDEWRDALVQSLANISGALKESYVWNPGEILTRDLEKRLKAFSSIEPGLVSLNLRADALCEELSQRTDLSILTVMRMAIKETYKGEKPEKANLLATFPNDRNFFQEFFKPLYFDSLLLRKEDVEVYCEKNHIIQVNHVKGFRLKGFQPPAKPAATATVPVVITQSSRQQKPPQPELTQEEAAKLAGVTERTIRNWENGSGVPEHYPGRQSRTAFLAFIARRESYKRLKNAAQAINKARPGGDMSEFSEGEEL